MRRRYYGKKLPKLPSMPLVCPEQSDAYETWSTEDLNKVWEEDGKSHEEGQNYEDGKEYNYWFVSPEELSATDENGIGIFNLNTDAAPEKWIDVNIIEYFNKRRRKDGLYCYSCVPGYVAGYESYEHQLPLVGSDYTVFETINGVRKITNIDSRTTKYIDNSNYASRNLIIGMSPEGTGGFYGNIYYMKIYDENGELLYNIESEIGRGLVETKSNTVVFSSASATEYTKVAGTITTNLPIPHDFSVKVKFSCTATSQIFGLGRPSGQRNKIQIETYVAQGALAVYGIANSTQKVYSSNVYKKDTDNIIIVEMVCNPNSKDDQKLAIYDKDGVELNKITTKRARACYYPFTNSSTKRVVIVNSESSTALDKPFEHAVWLYTGRCERSEGKLGVPSTLRVIHRNPRIKFTLPIHAYQNMYIIGGALIKNISLQSTSFTGVPKISSVYIYNDSKLNYAESSAAYYFSSSKIGREYIDITTLFQPVKMYTNTSIEFGKKARSKYESDKGIVYYIQDDGNSILLTAENKYVNFLNEVDNGEYKHVIKDNCTKVFASALDGCLSGFTGAYTIDFNNVKVFGHRFMAGLGGVFLGNKVEEGEGGKKHIFEIHTSWELASQAFYTISTKFDEIRFLNDGQITEFPYSSLSLGAQAYKMPINLYLPNYITDKLRYINNVYINISMLCPTLYGGNAYINFGSVIALKKSGGSNSDYDKIWIGQDAENYIPIGEPIETVAINGITYNRYKALYYNIVDGDIEHKYLVDCAYDNGEEEFTLEKGYKIIESSFGNGVYIFASHPTIRTLHLENSAITNVCNMCRYWIEGGTIYLPKSIMFRQKIGTSYINDYIGTVDCATNAGARLHVYMPDTIEAPVRYATTENKLERDVLLMQTHELEAERLVLHVPVSKEQEYISNGWGTGIAGLETY